MPDTARTKRKAAASRRGASKSTSLPLEGVRILDFTIAMSGPLAAQRLGDLGADVIKVESFGGDLTRIFKLMGVSVDGETTSYLALNRNKRSIAIDLKTQSGLDVVRDLARTSDVVLQNFRPGVAERLKIAYSDLRRISPKLVYVSISGYGTSGPLVDAPGQDLLVQSFSGMTFSAGARSDPPHPAPSYVIDACASHLATEAVLAGLVHRGRTGRGQHVETSLLAAALEIQCQEVMTYFQTGECAPRGDAPFASAWLEPPYGIYRTEDGWMALSQNDLCVIAEVVECDVVAEFARSAPDRHRASKQEIAAWRDGVYQAIQNTLRTRMTEEWVRRLSARKVWCGPVNSYAESLSHEQTRPFISSVSFGNVEAVRGVGHAFAFSETPELPLRSPPRLGEHTAEILREVGYSDARIEELGQEGAIR